MMASPHPVARACDDSVVTVFATPQQIADRARRAVDAAVGVGRELGLTVTEPRVLHNVFSVVVHLAPAPVVARVPTVLPNEPLPSVAQRQRAELDVTRWLAEQGMPVIAPSPLVPPEPFTRDGFAMTFWQFVEAQQGGVPDYAAATETVVDLHATLRAYPGPLSFLSAADPQFISDSLATLDRHPDLLAPADLDRARREWQVLEPLTRSAEAFGAAYPGVELQPVHGDSPTGNVFAGVDGPLFADFEMITLGPVEWDLAGLGPDLESAYDRAARRHGMPTLRKDVLGFVNAVGMLRSIAYLTLAPELPPLVEVMRPTIDQWRTVPFAGGHTG